MGLINLSSPLNFLYLIISYEQSRDRWLLSVLDIHQSRAFFSDLLLDNSELVRENKIYWFLGIIYFVDISIRYVCRPF